MRKNRRFIDLCVLVGVIALACCFWRAPGHPLHGAWQTVADGETVRVEFRPDGIMSLQAEGRQVHGSYRADLEPNPHHLDVFLEGEVTRTIFDFPEKDQLRVMDTKEDEPRPASFFDGARVVILTRAR